MKEENKLITIEGTLAEMAGEKTEIDVPVANGVDIKALIEGDDDPMFVVVEALNESVSANNRMYSSETIKSVAEQINSMKPDAYQGHMRDEERPFANPDSKTIWVGAKVHNVKGKKRLFIKGYVLPYAKELKQYLRAAKAVGKKIAVSIYGTAKELLEGDFRKVMDFKLESIDWARGVAAGVPTLGYMAITREMEDDAKNSDWVKVIEDYNTIREIAVESVKEEIKKDRDSKLQVISEMLDVPVDSITSVISEMKDTIANQEEELTNYYIDKELESKVPSKLIRGVVKTLVVAEMSKSVYNRTRASEIINSVVDSDMVSNILSEMSRKLDINPKEGSGYVDSRQYTTVK